jgi:hypothetical protein
MRKEVSRSDQLTAGLGAQVVLAETASTLVPRDPRGRDPGESRS